MAVNLSLLAGAGWQFFDDNGDPLSGGKLNTYAAGTTTPLATYTSSSGATPNTNPIILNAAGRLSGSGEIWLTEGVLYKFVLTDANNVLIGTYDNVSGATDGTSIYAALANTADPAKGDALVGFRQSNNSGNLPNAVGRTVHQKLQESVSVKDFGAVGDGVTNDQTAFQNAINSAASTVYVPDGTYKINSKLNLRSNLTIKMEPNATLDFSSVGTANYLDAAGTAAAGLNTTANVVLGATTISVADTSSLAVGDMLLLSSNAIFDPNRTSSRIGEIVFVKSLLPTTVTTTTPIQDNYSTADAAKIQKITPIQNLYVYGGQIVGNTTPNTGDLGVKVFYGNNIAVENVYFKNIDGACIQFINCVDAWARSCIFETGVSNVAYGVSFADATRDSGCVDSTFLDLRHSLSTNNTAGGFGVVRRILFSNNIVYNSAVSLSGSGGDAIDTHAAAEDIHIVNNTCFASSGIGINVECASAEIIGNQIVDTFSHGINITNHTSRVGRYVVSNNSILRANGSASASGIRVDTLSTDAAIDSLIVANNAVKNAASTGILINSNITDQTISNVSVMGNVVTNSESTSASVHLLKVLNASVTGNAIQVFADGPSGIRVDSAVNATIGNNTVSLPSGASTSSAFNISSASLADSTNVVVAGNSVNSPSAAGSRGIFISSNAVGVVLGRNNFQSCTTPIQGGISYTIASDAISIVGDVNAITVDTEGGAPTDDLSTINGGIDRQILIVRTANSARDVTLKDGVGNLRLSGDFTLSHVEDTIALMFIGALWYELSRSDNNV